MKSARWESDHRQEPLLEQEDCRIDYLPTLSEIRAACAGIRAEWTSNEKRRRYVGELSDDEPSVGWRPPVIDTSHFALSTGGVQEA